MMKQLIGFVGAVTILACLAIWMPEYMEARESRGGHRVNVLSNQSGGTSDPEFIAFWESIHRDRLLDYVDRYNETGQVDLDSLSKCADFDAYSAYLRISKLESVKKFEYALRFTDSLLEFQDRLAR
ncbi:hypothetical protein [Rhodopirellula bahusiensis]|uniref:hypothetical protein n=1 Tax=Rhodopirellula bahusiensis TaxID=2014065 RepID=UPI0032974240